MRQNSLENTHYPNHLLGRIPWPRRITTQRQLQLQLAAVCRRHGNIRIGNRIAIAKVLLLIEQVADVDVVLEEIHLSSLRDVLSVEDHWLHTGALLSDRMADIGEDDSRKSATRSQLTGGMMLAGCQGA